MAAALRPPAVGWVRRITPAFHTALWAGALAPLAGLALGRPELVAVGVPLLALAAAALAGARRPDVEVTAELSRTAAVEGEDVDLRLTLRSAAGAADVRVQLDLPAAVAPRGPLGAPTPSGRPDAAPALQVRVPAGATVEVAVPLRCERWGGHRMGVRRAVVHDVLGVVEHVAGAGPPLVLRVHPRPELVRTLLRPWSTTARAGNQLSRRTGEGIEFAGVRPFRPGDRVRSLNWRASARRGEPWVTEHQLERNADVVLFLDTFAELGVPPTTTLDLTIRAATALGRGYLGERDRVGLVVFGGYLRWLLPRMGTRQAHRLAAALIDAEVAHSDAWKDVDVLPRRTLPSGCLVVALTPLLDRRTVGALADLRARGFDVAVIDTLPAALGPRPTARTDPAERMLDLRRAAIRARYQRLGLGIGTWEADAPLEAALAQVAAFRRHVPRTA